MHIFPKNTFTIETPLGAEAVISALKNNANTELSPLAFPKKPYNYKYYGTVENSFFYLTSVYREKALISFVGNVSVSDSGSIVYIETDIFRFYKFAITVFAVLFLIFTVISRGLFLFGVISFFLLFKKVFNNQLGELKKELCYTLTGNIIG